MSGCHVKMPSYRDLMAGYIKEAAVAVDQRLHGGQSGTERTKIIEATLWEAMGDSIARRGAPKP